MILLFKANLLAYFLLEGLKFFLPCVWRILLNILLRFFISPHPSLIPHIASRNGKGQGRGDIARGKFPLFNSNTFFFLLEIIPQLKIQTFNESFQKCVSSRQPMTGKGRGRMVYVLLHTIPLACKINAHLSGPS